MARRIVLKSLGHDPLKLQDDLNAGKIDVATATELASDLFLDYRKTLIEIVTQPTDPRAGMVGSEVVEAVEIGGKIKRADKFVTFEEAEYATVKRKTEAFKWRVAHENIKQFLDDVNGAEGVDLNIPPPRN